MTTNPSSPPDSSPIHPRGVRTVMELFDISPAAALAAVVTAVGALVVSLFFFIRSAPPDSITITSGPAGSVFERHAEKYAKILESKGVHAQVLRSNGSLENLQRLADPSSRVDVGIVQSGLPVEDADRLVSLGSVSNQPLFLFYRGAPFELLSELAGRRVAIGAQGSGTRKFALTLLEANGLHENGSATFLNVDGDEGSELLLSGKADAAFLMGESASIDNLRKLLRSKEVHLFSFKQATAYSRKIDYLNVLELPEGAIDLGLNIPPRDVTLLGPTVELLAKKSLHPALSDVLLEAAVEVHGRPGIFQRRGEFPAMVEHTVKISDDAKRYYTSGKSLLYRLLPFWLASLLSRIFVVFVPTLVILVPALKSIPAFFRWRTRIKIRRRYRELLELEEAFLKEKSPVEREHIREHFRRIDSAVNRMRIAPAFADQFYGLRGHIDYVRQLVTRREPETGDKQQGAV